MRPPLPIPAAASLLAFAGAVALAPASLAREPAPILVTAMVHVDPLPTVPDQAAILRAYGEHRDGWLWYLELARRTELAISAQMTGVYAEACVRQGHAADFASCMPGGPHHLGTHLHANVKGTADYVWQGVPERLFHDPATVARVFADNLPWVNRVFEGNGCSSADNWFFHGSHATFDGMGAVLFDPAGGFPYDNRVAMVGALRGRMMPYRGDFLAEPDVRTGAYVKLPEVGGIIGEDSVHGPEGMVWGTVPFQRRDFLASYLEWREGVRRGECGPVRHFNWMVHPYQLAARYRGTDGRPTRTSIEELVAWLRENFIDQADDTGAVVARFANAAEIRREFEAFERECPVEAGSLQRALATGEQPRHLPAILDRMASTSHVGSLDLHPDLAAHLLRDTATGADLVLVWARGSATATLAALPWPRLRVTRGDGSSVEAETWSVVVGAEPVLVEEASGTPARPRPPRPRLGSPSS